VGISRFQKWFDVDVLATLKTGKFFKSSGKLYRRNLHFGLISLRFVTDFKPMLQFKKGSRFLLLLYDGELLVLPTSNEHRKGV